MFVSQAIVSSTDTNTFEKTELICKSPDISDRLAETLCQWSPGRDELAKGETQSVNCFHPGNDTVAISRSVLGPEQSGENPVRHVTSHIVLLKGDQFKSYRKNPILVANVLRSMGLVFMKPDLSRKPLQLLNLPNNSFDGLVSLWKTPFAEEVKSVLKALEIHQQVAVFGLRKPTGFLSHFFDAISTNSSFPISFATGLKVDKKKPFSLHFFDCPDPSFQKELAQRQVRMLSFKKTGASGPDVILKTCAGR